MTGQELLDRAVVVLFERFSKTLAENPANKDMTEGQKKALLAAGLGTIYCDDMLASLREHSYWVTVQKPSD